jgi:hypothetical protein
MNKEFESHSSIKKIKQAAKSQERVAISTMGDDGSRYIETHDAKDIFSSSSFSFCIIFSLHSCIRPCSSRARRAYMHIYIYIYNALNATFSPAAPSTMLYHVCVCVCVCYVCVWL